ncbi:hypothetical protein JKP88DRAFT_287987 [Tribonema minus]|uniref:Uncharacterized protein n=1 Tax=Tribonema minus TaxID=303371 RepID=A0A835Z635_9STRA|nr:hypothetical protein JKP88DRAFT_287987 [Tribonema minus]
MRACARALRDEGLCKGVSYYDGRRTGGPHTFYGISGSCTNPPFAHEQQLKKFVAPELLPPQAQPSVKLVQECRSQRFLLWTRNDLDFNAGHAHKGAAAAAASRACQVGHELRAVGRWAMSCALWEAHSLDRTLVIDSFQGMNRGGSSGAQLTMTLSCPSSVALQLSGRQSLTPPLALLPPLSPLLPVPLPLPPPRAADGAGHGAPRALASKMSCLTPTCTTVAIP